MAGWYAVAIAPDSILTERTGGQLKPHNVRDVSAGRSRGWRVDEAGDLPTHVRVTQVGCRPLETIQHPRVPGSMP